LTITNKVDDDENEQFGNIVVEGQSEGFESMIKEFEVEDEGAPLEGKVARAINTVWRKPRESEGYKNAARRAKKPVNVQFSEDAVNDEQQNSKKCLLVLRNIVHFGSLR
jgi:hypothetical protein